MLYYVKKSLIILTCKYNFNYYIFSSKKLKLNCFSYLSTSNTPIIIMNLAKSVSFASLDNVFTRLVYSSTLREESNNYETMSKIISTSQANNSRLNIGGEIIWNSPKASIIQIIEGPSLLINALYNKIKNDTRHTNIVLIACQDITKEQTIYDVWDASSVSKNITDNYTPKINDFEMINVIGTGGFSTVIRANNNVTNKIYALKAVSKKKMTRDMFNAVESEHTVWKKLSSLNNKFINPLHWCLEDPLNIYFIMDMANSDMYDMLKEHKLTSENCLFYFCEILCGLKFIHDNKVIYRDMKLENILLKRDGHIVLNDFGVSDKVCKKEKRMCGTPVYFAPELISNQMIHQKNDIWALGIVLYEMTGRPLPWEGREKSVMFALILQSQLTLDLHWAEYLNALIQMCTIQEITTRPTCDELILHLVENQLIESWETVENKELVPPPIIERGTHSDSTFDTERPDSIMDFQI